MSVNEPKRRDVALSLILFVLLLFNAAVLLLVAFVVWLSTLVGSILLGLTITALILSIVALIIYNRSLKPIVKRAQEDIKSITAIAEIIHTSYEWLITKAVNTLSSLAK